MITKFKVFEYVNQDELEIGDYVICDENPQYSNTSEYTNTHIGKYIYNSDIGTFNHIILFDYDDIPESILASFSIRSKGCEKCQQMSREEIKYWSKNKEDLEIILNSKKYNL